MNRLHAVPSYLRRYGYSTKVFLYTPSKVPSKYLHSFVRTDNMYNNKVNTRTWISDEIHCQRSAENRASSSGFIRFHSVSFGFIRFHSVSFVLRRFETVCAQCLHVDSTQTARTTDPNRLNISINNNIINIYLRTMVIIPCCDY